MFSRPVLFSKFIWNTPRKVIFQFFLFRFAFVYGFSELCYLDKETQQIEFTFKDLYIFESLFAPIWNAFKRFISIESKHLTHYIGGLYKNLNRGNGNTTLYTTETTVTKNPIQTNFEVVGLLQIDEGLIDAVEQVVARKEITQSSLLMKNNNHICIDLSRVTSKDIHAAIIARKIIQISNHHFGRYWNLNFSNLCWMVLGLSMDCGLAYLSIRDHWDVVLYPWVLTLADISALPKLVYLSHVLEYEADRGAVELTARAGYNPLGMLWLLEYQTQRETAVDSWWALVFGVYGVPKGLFYSTPLNSRRQQALVEVMKQDLLLVPELLLLGYDAGTVLVDYTQTKTLIYTHIFEILNRHNYAQ